MKNGAPQGPIRIVLREPTDQFDAARIFFTMSSVGRLFTPGIVSVNCSTGCPNSLLCATLPMKFGAFPTGWDRVKAVKVAGARARTGAPRGTIRTSKHGVRIERKIIEVRNVRAGGG
ncbi:hypothetical protein [Ramlibacter sp.]|uniref:hypothetical protein n=1 Tax=Ramlibacter sp. TaxID=1917967 RepID=UPI003D09D8BF